MELEGTYQFKATPEDVWAVITDPGALSRALPGCKEFAPRGHNQYSVTLVLGIAFVKGTYTGRISMTDVRHPTSYHLALSGKGPLGGVRAGGEVVLRPSGDDMTTLRYKGEAHVGGRVAGLGKSVIRAGAQLALQQFFAALERDVLRAARDRRSAGDEHIAVTSI